MALTLIEPVKLDYETHTFECQKCQRSISHVVLIM